LDKVVYTFIFFSTHTLGMYCKFCKQFGCHKISHSHST